MAEVRLRCGHLVLFANPAPQPGDWLWCTRCDTGVTVARPDGERSMDHGPCTVQLPPGRRRRTADRRTRATDWAAGPPAKVLLACTHVRWYRPPAPARGDAITCGCCGQSTLVLRPVRRTARHGGPWTPRQLDVPA